MTAVEKPNPAILQNIKDLFGGILELSFNLFLVGAQAAITKSRSLGGLSNRNYCLLLVEVGSPPSGSGANSPLGLLIPTFSLCPHLAERVLSLSLPLLIRLPILPD